MNEVFVLLFTLFEEPVEREAHYFHEIGRFDPQHDSQLLNLDPQYSILARFKDERIESTIKTVNLHLSITVATKHPFHLHCF